MLPKRKLVTRQERATGRCLKHVKATPKHSKPPFPLKNTQPRQLRSFASAAAALQKSSTPSRELIARPSTRAQKRKHESEDEHSQKRSRRDLPSASRPATDSKNERLDNGRRGSEPASQLTEGNLKKLERETSSNMDSMITPSGRTRKRGLSRQASSSDLNPDIVSVPSQKSSASNSFYRYHILEGAKMFIHPEPPPKEIRSQLDIIYKRKISDKRKRQISDIAKKKSQNFINNLRGAHREDDLVELIYEAFREMYPDEVFDCPRKADWNPSLKPDFQQEVWDPNALGQVHAVDNIVHRPSKRKQGDRSIPTPDASQSSMPPPTAPSPVALPQSRQDGAVKTPRPDFTIGLRHSTVASALVKRGLSKYKADDLLKFLQREDKLCSDPTQNFLNVRFPILVIEGKAYATGKTVFEAENQAAVSGSCMINLQKQLIGLFKGVFPNSERSINPEGGKTPLAFSICTQGPIIEFWVHYFVLEEDICMHYMNLLKLCYGSLADGLEDFFILLECLMSWYKTDFLKEVADELFDLANHIARP